VFQIFEVVIRYICWGVSLSSGESSKKERQKRLERAVQGETTAINEMIGQSRRVRHKGWAAPLPSFI
jgi:hypothetical protein